jgi:DNA modification methylase
MIHVGDCLETLRGMDTGSVQTCVTSPPYFGLRDYGHDGQIGLEPTPAEFVAKLVAVFREVRRVLREDGTCWVNLGDSYANDGKWGGSSGGKHANALHGDTSIGRTKVRTGLKPKELIGIPWRVAFALQEDGWCLRQDIIWHKPNPMPESVRDRCTKAHEYLFLLSKSPRYYFDYFSIAEPLAASSIERLSQPTLATQAGSDRVPGKTNGTMKAVGSLAALGDLITADGGKRNKRSVWTVTTKPFKGAHFATFPPDLIEPCILAGSRPGDVVLDPFMGAGTTAVVCEQHGRRWLGCELNPEYALIAEARIAAVREQMAADAAEAALAAQQIDLFSQEVA